MDNKTIIINENDLNSLIQYYNEIKELLLKIKDNQEKIINYKKAEQSCTILKTK